MILPWSVKFDKGQAPGNCLFKVVICQDQQSGLQKEKNPYLKKNMTYSRGGRIQTTLLKECDHFLYAHTHFPFNWLSSVDVDLSFFLFLYFLAGEVSFQLFVHEVFKRVHVSFSFVLLCLQMETEG